MSLKRKKKHSVESAKNNKCRLCFLCLWYNGRQIKGLATGHDCTKSHTSLALTVSLTLVVSGSVFIGNVKIQAVVTA